MCASNANFLLKDRDKNKLAVEAIELFKKKAELCENQRQKVAKIPGEGGGLELESPLTHAAGAAIHLDLPGPSTSHGTCSGAIAKKSPATTPSGKGRCNFNDYYCINTGAARY